ncbi:hypothetical protein ACFWQ9_29540 [Streptomyces albidoflavus]|uniref:hypothetical protein n=1 Tax=Streptomyces albidoflavus TaxID=1886 RepID=UPI0036695137|nr:hypothetical protein OIF23_30970 [Streptomyces albidoflavus]
MVTQIIEPDEITRPLGFTAPAGPVGGFYEDMEQEDNDRGLEPDETEGQQRLGRYLRRVIRQQDAAIPAHRRAPRTLAEMKARLGAAQPGYERQPVLVLHRPTMKEDACPLCGLWECNPANCPPAGVTPANSHSARGSSCGVCGGSGTRQVTVNKTGSDGKSYQGVRNEPCPAC